MANIKCPKCGNMIGGGTSWSDSEVFKMWKYNEDIAAQCKSEFICKYSC